jgi:chemotaxis protein MotB
MKRCNTRSRRAPDPIRTALLLVVLLAVGCVTKGTYDEDVGRLETQNRALEKKVEMMSRSMEALDKERVRLAEELEDLRQARDVLEQDVGKLRRTKELLTEHLRERDEQVAELSKLSSTYEGLVSDLQSEVTAGQIEIEQLRDGIRLNLPQDILFPSGASTLQASGKVVLTKVAENLSKLSHRVEVQGHSDDVPLSASLARRFGTNWELAGARASQVVRLFHENGVDPSRLTAISFGEFAPVADNETPEGRALNRRIEIRLIPMDAAPTEQIGAETPEQAAPASS